MRPMVRPGTKPARNRAPMEVLVRLPKTTIVRQGGIMTPMPPAAVTSAAANPGSYPLLFMGGIMTLPMAAVSAADDPEISEKNMVASMTTMPIPPRMWPDQGVGQVYHPPGYAAGLHQHSRQHKERNGKVGKMSQAGKYFLRQNFERYPAGDKRRGRARPYSEHDGRAKGQQ